MEINYRFPDFLWFDKIAWVTTLSINGSGDAFELRIKNEEIDIVKNYEYSPSSKEKTDELLEIALKDDKLREKLNEAQHLIKEFEKLMKVEDYTTLEIQLIKFEKGEAWEKIQFFIKGYDFFCDLTIIDEENDYDYYFDVSTKERSVNYPYIRQALSYLPRGAYTALKEKIYRHPSIRLRKLTNK